MRHLRCRRGVLGQGILAWRTHTEGVTFVTWVTCSDRWGIVHEHNHASPESSQQDNIYTNKSRHVPDQDLIHGDHYFTNWSKNWGNEKEVAEYDYEADSHPFPFLQCATWSHVSPYYVWVLGQHSFEGPLGERLVVMLYVTSLDFINQVHTKQSSLPYFILLCLGTLYIWIRA